jgi:3-oxoadipate enol-lactonase
MMGVPIAEPTVSGEGPAVVLAHPLGADRRYWDSVVGSLHGRTLITYELPGHGKAQPADAQYTIEELGEQLLLMTSTLGLQTFSIVGVSIGGLVAQAVGTLSPQSLQRLVLADTVAVYPPDFAANLSARAHAVVETGTAGLVDATLAMWFTADYLAADGPGVGLVKSMLASAHPQGYAHACRALVAADLTTSTPQINVPTLVLCGSDDLPAFTSGARWLDEQMPDTRLSWLEGGRHGAVLECSDATIAALDAFLPRM